MARTTFSGPVISNNGFGSPIQYITASSPSTVDIQPGAQVVILSIADGGPASVTLRLPKVFTTDGGPFNILNADPRYIGVRGYILNYDAAATHVLQGTDGQPVNGDADGVVIPAASVVEYAGNGNPTAAWAASEQDLCTGA